MVQKCKCTTLCKCSAQNFIPNRRDGTTSRRLPSGKFSTVNFIPPPAYRERANIMNRPADINASPRISCPIQSRNSKSYCEKSMTSSCIVGFMKFIQHQCYPKRKQEVDQRQVGFVHDDVLNCIQELKCDVECLTDIEKKNTGKFSATSGKGCSRKILTRMALRVCEIEGLLLKRNTPTCGEFLTKRKIILNLIKTLQKTVCCNLQGEIEAFGDRKAKLCNLLRCLQCIENEFRCMTKGIKEDCCSGLETSNKAIAQKSNLTLPPVRKQSSKLCTNINPKNYEVTGVDVVYTKSKISSGSENREECVNKKVTCRIPTDGEPICEVKIQDGQDVLQVCDSQQLKETICRFSNIWQESARQLIDAFYSC